MSITGATTQLAIFPSCQNYSILLKVMKTYFFIKNTALKCISLYLKTEHSQFTLMSSHQILKPSSSQCLRVAHLEPTLFNCYVSTPMEIIPDTEKNFVSDYCEGTECDVWLVYDPMSIPRQLRFSLYSGAVITEGLM